MGIIRGCFRHGAFVIRPTSGTRSTRLLAVAAAADPARRIIPGFDPQGAGIPAGLPGAAVSPIFDHARHDADNDDDQDHQGEILLDQWQIAEEVAAVEK